MINQIVIATIALALPLCISATQHDLLQDAEKACAGVRGPAFYVCLEDVVETGDVNMATFWITSEDSSEEGSTVEEIYRDLLEKARKSCALVATSADFEMCVDDVMESKNLGLADLWPKHEADSFHKRDFLLQKARVACAKVTGTGFDSCIEDVLNTGDLQFADLWSQTEERQRLRGTNKPNRSAGFW